ncbi:MAG: 4Fe-4S binding protein [Peptococcaceae bacterium]|nr:4Fe-4S binding protein [Peptococcaceae bacterium]
MTEYLELKATDCKHCYKCIRNCPVKAIRVSNNQAAVMQEECILCGRCFVSCPQNAKRIQNDLPKAQELLRGGVPVYVSLAPSFVANYPGAGIEDMEQALKKLGFAGAMETALGATLVKQRYDAMVGAGERSVIVSTCCHTVNMLAERHYPGALPYMAPVISPMQAHARSIRKRYPGAKVVFIGPCISKKAEAERYPDYVDCVLTFEELDAWLIEARIELPADRRRGQEDRTKDAEGKTRLFPTVGGILRTMRQSNPDYNYIAIDGIDHCIAALKDIAAGGLEHCFIEMSACSGSCIGGPCMSREAGLVRGTAQVHACAPGADFEVEPLAAEEMEKHLRLNLQPRPVFGEKAITGVLQKIGKTKPEDELNCGSCGYDTCREKAAAVLEGKATLEMCLPYLMSKAQSFSDVIIRNTPNGIIVLNEDLEVRQINEAARRILNVKREEDILSRGVTSLMDPALFLDAPGEGDSREYLAEYGRFIKLTVVRDEEYGVIIGIMKDITDTENARAVRREMADQTIRVTDEVIDKQMRTVQEIASLLGETTAETKIALTKLKETLRNDQPVY